LAGSVAPQRYDPTDRILDFLQKVQSAHAGVAKTGEGFSSDSAIWYMESSLNYTLGNIGKAYNMSTVDSITVPLTLGATSTSNAVVYAAFENLVALLAPLTTEEQHIAVVDVVEPLPGACAILVAVTIGSDYSKGAPNTAYSATSFHFWGGFFSPSTQCGCAPPPTVQGSVPCAHKIIEQRINAANFYALSPNEYVTDVETWYANQFENLSVRAFAMFRSNMLGPAPLGDGYRDSKLFSWKYGLTQGSACLSPSEMAFWTGNATSGSWSAITTIKNKYCPTKLFLGCTFNAWNTDASTFSPPPPSVPTGSITWHQPSFRFGRIVSTVNG